MNEKLGMGIVFAGKLPLSLSETDIGKIKVHDRDIGMLRAPVSGMKKG